MSVYFIRAGNYVKIGYAQNPAQRLRELQTGNPRKLELIGSIAGGVEREAEIHRLFNDFRVNGEWFELTTDILAYVQAQQKKASHAPASRPVRNRQDSGEGWIEYSKRGTRRYAYRRQWVMKDGRWMKSAPVRIKEIPPMNEEEYRAMLLGQGEAPPNSWIEYKPGEKRKDGSRLYYPRYRQWKPGNEGKRWRGPVPGLRPLTEVEYRAWKKGGSK